jgi:hypothetical protein
MRVVGPPAFITGPMWGTFHLVNDGGSWEGTWTGERDEQGFAYIRVVGHGMGGYAGLHYEMQAQRLSPDPFALYQFEAWILDPGN